MKNTFNISEKEKNRILNLHESYTDSFGTGNLIKEGKENECIECWKEAGRKLGKEFDDNLISQLLRKKPNESALDIIWADITLSIGDMRLIPTFVKALYSCTSICVGDLVRD